LILIGWNWGGPQFVGASGNISKNNIKMKGRLFTLSIRDPCMGEIGFRERTGKKKG